MRTLTAYGIGVVIVLAALNGVAWKVGTPRLHDLNVFSAGFALGVLGTYISAWLNRQRRSPDFTTDRRIMFLVEFPRPSRAQARSCCAE